MLNSGICLLHNKNRRDGGACHKDVCDVVFPACFDYKDDGTFPKPPSYNVATTLPSYDEAERIKAETTVPLVTGRVSL